MARGDTEIELTRKGVRLLEMFMRHPGEVLRRDQLLEQAWDYDYEKRTNIVDVYIALSAPEARRALWGRARSRPCAARATGLRGQGG